MRAVRALHPSPRHVPLAAEPSPLPEARLSHLRQQLQEAEAMTMPAKDRRADNVQCMAVPISQIEAVLTQNTWMKGELLQTAEKLLAVTERAAAERMASESLTAEIAKLKEENKKLTEENQRLGKAIEAKPETKATKAAEAPPAQKLEAVGGSSNSDTSTELKRLRSQEEKREAEVRALNVTVQALQADLVALREQQAAHAAATPAAAQADATQVEKAAGVRPAHVPSAKRRGTVDDRLQAAAKEAEEAAAAEQAAEETAAAMAAAAPAKHVPSSAPRRGSVDDRLQAAVKAAEEAAENS